jgi:RNA polymerase sigma-70 factor (ECF subfamily)
MTTVWGDVCAARSAETDEARRAWERLCRSYWYPLYVFIRREGHSAHDAEDLTQAFLARLIAKDGLAQVDPAKGKFRVWLKRSCVNFLRNHHDWVNARKRKPRGVLLSLDFQDAEGRYRLEPAHAQTVEGPEQVDQELQDLFQALGS